MIDTLALAIYGINHGLPCYNPKGRTQSHRVGTVQAQGCVDRLLDGIHQPQEIIRLPIRGSTGVDIKKVDAGLNLLTRQILDEIGVPRDYRVADSFTGTVYFFPN